MKSVKIQNINSFSNVFHRLIIIISHNISGIDFRSFYCHWTIHPYLKIRMIFNQPVILYMTDQIQHFLSSTHCKCWNHKISASIQGFLNHSCHLQNVICSCSMMTISISRFHNNNICMFRFSWILN